MLDFGFALGPWAVVALCLVIFIAAMVRGFAGFGDALVYLPIAGIFLPPIPAILSFMLVAAIGPIPLLPQALRTVDRRIALPLNLALIVTVPIGVALLRLMDPEGFRIVLAMMAITLAGLMAAGWRPRITATPASAVVVGVLSGVVGGWSGVPGAILIFYFLNSPLPTAQIRAQGLLVLFVFDLSLVLLFFVGGDLTLANLILPLVLLPFYVVGGFAGRALFDPERREFFRSVAIGVIFLSGLVGLPWAVFV